MRIFLDTIGCRLNQSEIETFARQFRGAGHTLAASAQDADLAVINTCAVTADAAAVSRQKVRGAARQGAKEVVVTGCWATLAPDRAASLPGVSRVVANPEKDLLVAHTLGLPRETFDLEPVAREPLPGARLRTRAFIKVQDGCDNRCTFCITTVARGPGRSRPLEEVVADIQAAVEGGAQEVVLTGVHLGSWGQDFSPRDSLQRLVEVILHRSAVPRVRLSSLEPWDLDAQFFSLWEGEARLCRHLHLPLQAGCDQTLRRMARKTTRGSFARLVEAARAACPEMAITTDLIAGFPGETEAEFAETLAFVQALGFAGGHIFTYSARPGTAAATMPDQVPHARRKERNARLREGLAAGAAAYQARFTGQVLPVLWERAAGLGPEGWEMAGLTDNYLRVFVTAPRDLWNEITPVVLGEPLAQGLQGRLVTGRAAGAQEEKP